MKIKKFLAAATAFFSLVSFSTATMAQQKADPAVYGALPDVLEAHISPDGKTVATLRSIDGGGILVFSDLDNPDSAPLGVRIGDTNARAIEWADNEYLLLLLSQSENVRTDQGLTTIEFFRWVAISKTTQKSQMLFGNEPGYFIADAGDFISAIPGEPGKALFSRTSTRGKYRQQQTGSRIEVERDLGYSTFVVDLKTGEYALSAEGELNTVDWLADETGQPFARVDYDEIKQRREIYVRQPGASNYSLLQWFDEPKGSGAVIRFHGLIENGRALAASTYGSADKRAILSFNLDNGEVGETLFSHPTYDLSRVTYDPLTAQATGARYIDDLPRTFFFDPQYQNIQKMLRDALPGAAPMISSKSRDGQRMIVEAIYTDHPKQFFLFDRASMSLDMIAPSYTKIDGVVYATKEKFDYTSSDGITIPGYLTVPTNASKQNMPLIILPHGGPESRADQSFDYWSFFYAARRYLVYEPNFRGSDGYGFNFKSAGYGEWGRKMQDDITEGVQKLIADGIADPNRICIVGGSYGGYAALAGATLTPDLYACAVSVNGVSDLPAMLGDESKESPLSEDYWEIRMGGSRFNPDELNAVSPAKLADQAGPPILLIHAKDDVVVPISQSRRMRNALRSAGKPHEYVELKGEDHWLSTGEMRTEMLRRSIEFIDAHIGQ